MGENTMKALSDLLFTNKYIEFWENDMYFAVYKLNDRFGYGINVYVSDEKDEQGIFFVRNLIDATLCKKEALEAIKICFNKQRNILL